MENRLAFAQWQWVGGEVGWEVGVSRYKLLYIK